MATAEKLLQDAQYAFQCISFGESRDNTRNRSRAKSLCKKIISKYPGTMESGEAHAILRRLGEEAYTSQMAIRHRHTSQAEHHRSKPASQTGLARSHITQQSLHSAKALERAKTRTPVPVSQYAGGDEGVVERLDWGRLLGLLLGLPKIVLGLVAFAGLFLFGIFGPLLFVPLILFVMFTGPFRQVLKPEQRREMNAFIARANEYMEKRQRGEI